MALVRVLAYLCAMPVHVLAYTRKDVSVHVCVCMSLCLCSSFVFAYSLFLCTHDHAYWYLFLCMVMCLCLFVSEGFCKCPCMHVCMNSCAYTSTFVCVSMIHACVYTCVSLYLCMNACVSMHVPECCLHQGRQAFSHISRNSRRSDMLTVSVVSFSEFTHKEVTGKTEDGPRWRRVCRVCAEQA